VTSVLFAERTDQVFVLALLLSPNTEIDSIWVGEVFSAALDLRPSTGTTGLRARACDWKEYGRQVPRRTPFLAQPTQTGPVLRNGSSEGLAHETPRLRNVVVVASIALVSGPARAATEESSPS
jgi:hypothetical protein